ncbi:MAG TPA: TadE family type IV pilus minor pilin [Acidimicrobiales bacterium]|nr:TadE family type IV pilus minor pilin [Acidimicrobiales bacterium]
MTRFEAAGDSGPPQHRLGERGQSSVELALSLPILFLLLMALLQVTVIARDHIQLTHAAREAAREAAVSDNRSAPRRAAIARSELEPGRLTVQVTGQRQGSRRVRAKLTYEVPTKVPVVGILVPDVTLKAEAAMRREGL